MDEQDRVMLEDGGPRAAERDRLAALIRTRCYQRGPRTLAAGLASSYYLDSKQVLFHGEALPLVALALRDCLESLRRDSGGAALQAIGGLEAGAIPMATALVYHYRLAGLALDGFFVRKANKGHGLEERIAGCLHAGWHVALLDDVVTTGGSVLDAAAEVERVGGVVRGVVCLVDRLQGAAERIGARYPFRAAYTVRELGL